jgi:hypothetical protein
MGAEAQRQQQAGRFAELIGLAPDDLFRGAMAAWSNLGPQVTSFDRALSVAAVVLTAAPMTADPVTAKVPAVAATWRRCGHCHKDIVAQGPRPDWAAVEPGPHPALFCPEARGDQFPVHEPAEGTGQRSFILAAGPGHRDGTVPMREVIEIDPAGQRSVFAVVPASHALELLDTFGRLYTYGREDRAAVDGRAGSGG